MRKIHALTLGFFILNVANAQNQIGVRHINQLPGNFIYTPHQITQCDIVNFQPAGTPGTFKYSTVKANDAPIASSQSLNTYPSLPVGPGQMQTCTLRVSYTFANSIPPAWRLKVNGVACSTCTVTKVGGQTTGEYSGFSTSGTNVLLRLDYSAIGCAWNQTPGGNGILEFELRAENKTDKPAIRFQAVMVGTSYTAVQGYFATPQLPLYILRDPPGDNSYSSMTSGSTTCVGQSFSVSTDQSANVWAKAKLGTSGSVGLIVETDYEIYGEVGIDVTAGQTETSSGEYELCMEAQSTFSTNPTGPPDDLFIGSAVRYAYGYSLTITRPAPTVIGKNAGFAFVPVDELSSYHYSESHILNSIIPSLEADMANFPPGSVEHRRAEDQLEVWEEALAMNNDLKATAPFEIQRNFNGGQSFNYSLQTTTSQSRSIDYSVYLDAGVSAEIGAYMGGSGVSAGGELRMRNEFGRGLTGSNQVTNTMAYHLQDDDVGDAFSVSVHKDLTLGTYVFKLNELGSATSCPHEGGTPLDQPQLWVGAIGQSTMTVDNVPFGSQANFPVHICNNSSEDRTYYLKFKSTTNLAGAILAGFGNTLNGNDNGIELSVPAGQCLGPAYITLTQPNLSVNDFENIELYIYPICEPDIRSSVIISAHFGYCEPTNSGDPAFGHWINAVHVGSISNALSGPSPYSDFTMQWTTNMSRNAPHMLTVTSAPDMNAPTAVAAWLDYDRNGNFSSDELIGQSTFTASNQPVDFQFTIPTTALNGTTRLRVRSAYLFPWDPDPLDPCYNYGYGEAEDYKVVINANTPVDCLGIPNGATWPGTPCDDNNAQTDNDRYNANCVCAGTLCTPFIVTISNGGPYCSQYEHDLSVSIADDGEPYTLLWSGPGLMGDLTSPNVQALNTVPGSYEYTLTATNSCGSVQASTTVVFDLQPMGAFSYAPSWDPTNHVVCSNLSAYPVQQVLMLTPGGAFTADGDLMIDPVTGVINPSSITDGTVAHHVTYTIPAGGCPEFTTTAPVDIRTLLTYYPDQDNDGYGDPSNAQTVCYTAELSPPGQIWTSNQEDLCPFDPNKIDPGICGCSQPEPGDPCDDNDPYTVNDVWSLACQCAGTLRTAIKLVEVGNDAIDVQLWPGSEWTDNTGVSVVFTIRWPSANGMVLGTPDQTSWSTPPYCMQQGIPVIPNGEEEIDVGDWRYRTYVAGNFPQWPGPACTFPAHQWTTLVRIPVSGAGTCSTFEIVNDAYTAANNKDYYVTVNGIEDTGGIIGPGVQAGHCGPDCFGVVNGPDFPENPCDDGDPITVSDTWDDNCTCQGAYAYCVPTVDVAPQGHFIDGVQLGTLNNTSSGSGPIGGFTYYGGLFTTTLTHNDASALSITTGTVSSMRVVAWIDFDRSGTFDADEELGGFVSASANETQVIGFMVPDDAELGETVLRVRSMTSTVPDPIEPCAPYDLGETEDYIITIEPEESALFDCEGTFNGGAFPGAPCDDGDPATYADQWNAQCQCVGAPWLMPIRLKFLLQGPYNSVTGLMSDALRSSGLVPLIEPYTALGYTHVSGGGETVADSLLIVAGSDAIVDWVVVELRDAQDPALVISTQSALLQRDGDVVDTKGSDVLLLKAIGGDYHVVVRHRNHLGIMTASTFGLCPICVPPVDFTTSATTAYGAAAQSALGGTTSLFGLWAGDVTFDGLIKYTGAGNDRDPILLAIGGTVPTAVLSGQYRAEDVNMDGEVKYTGANNDRDPILQNVGGSVPTNTRQGQLP